MTNNSSYHLTQTNGVQEWTLNPESPEAKRIAMQNQERLQRDLLKLAEVLLATRVFH